MTDDQITASEAWRAFEEMRKAKGKRAPFTPLARKRILFELRRMDADGQDVEEVLWTSATNGWSGVFPIRRRGWQAPEQALTVESRAAQTTAEYLDSQRPADQAPEDRQRVREMLAGVRARVTGAS